MEEKQYTWETLFGEEPVSSTKPNIPELEITPVLSKVEQPKAPLRSRLHHLSGTSGEILQNETQSKEQS